jgi:predicted AAA+ superfamily ATPase
MLSVDYLASISNISKTTAIKYTKQLEEMNMLYVVHCSSKFRELNGTIKRHNNIYGRYSNFD